MREAVKDQLRRVGIDRSALIRRLIRLGHPRMRELRERAMHERGIAPALLRAAIRRLETGVVRVPPGHAGGIAFDMRYLPISHAHLGSIASGNLETSVQEAMVRHLGPGGVFYDVGANLGFFSLLAAHLSGLNAGHVYAFEAAPDNAAAIRRNVELNRVPNVTVIDKAVAARSGRARLQVVDDQSWSRLEEFGHHPLTERVIEVETVSIDALLAQGALPPPDLVKIDVEGAELAVLEGMRETIARHAPAIICELHDTQREFAAEMARHGYRLINLEGTAPVAEGAEHALALPPLHPGD